MLQPIFSMGQTWGGGVNRLATGLIAIWFGNYLSLADFSFELSDIASGELSFGILVQAAALVIISLLIGTVISYLGMPFATGFSPEQRTVRAAKVGATNNPVLISVYHDAMRRFETASGFFGLLTFCGALLILSLILQTRSSPQSSRAVAFEWEILAPALLALVFSLVLRRGVEAEFRAIDNILNTEDKPSPVSETEPAENV